MTARIKSLRIFAEIPENVRDAISQIDATVTELERKLNNARSICVKINELKSSEDYKSEEQIQETKNVLERKINRSNFHLFAVEQLTVDPAYINPVEVLECRNTLKRIDNLESLLSTTDTVQFLS